MAARKSKGKGMDALITDEKERKPEATPRTQAPRPTAERSARKLTYLFRHHEADRARLERIRNMRNLDWKVNIPERLIEVTKADGLEYRDATIAEELLVLPAMYYAELPSLSLRAERDTPVTEGLTTRLEGFTTSALFEDSGLRASGPPTHERVIDATFEGGA
ncbi:MAG: hypothetical protein Q8S13_03080, partial [Dehalococcoidia bacterium]|nr:hypothetical protein [Dehalococcoidia bacterium]